MDLLKDPGPSVLMSSNDEQTPSATYPGPSLSDAFIDEPSMLMSSDDADPMSTHPKANPVPSISTYPIPASPHHHPPSTLSSPESELLTPLTPLTPSPSPSPSPGHDRHMSLSPAPHTESLPPSISIDVPSSPDTALHTPMQPLSVQPTPSSSSHPSPLTLVSALENLIPFDAFTPPFDPAMSLQLDAHPGDAHASPSQPHSSTPQLQEHYPHTLPNIPQQLYAPPQPPPVLARDREVNIWKLACQERVEYMYVSFFRVCSSHDLTFRSLRRYGVDTIKAVVASEASHVSPDTSGSSSDSSSPSPQSPPTRFRLYTPASYTLDSGSPASGATSKARPLDDPDQDAEGETEEIEPDMDVEVDMDVDMEDDDEDYEDDDDLGDCDADADAEGDVELGAEVEGSSIPTGTSALEDAKVVDGNGEMVMVMDIDCRQGEADKENDTSIPAPTTPQPPPSTSLLGPSGELPATPGSILAMPIPPAFALPLRPQLPPLSSLHVPLLSEPPRAFMGRGTPPDRRRRVEWSISGHYPGCQADGIGVGLYLSTTHISESGSSQQNTGDETVGIALPVSIMHPMDAVHEHTHDHHLQPENRQSQQSHQHAGEWTSFLYAMLEGSDMNVCHTGAGIPSGASPSGSAPGNVSAVTGASQATDPAGWYELGLGAVHMSGVVSGVSGQLPLSHHHSVDDASSSTLRFALG